MKFPVMQSASPNFPEVAKNWNTCTAIPQIGSPCCTQNIENAAFPGVNSGRVSARRRIVTPYGSYCVATRKAHRHECLCYQERLARSMERSFHYEKDEMGLVFIDSAEQREGKSQKTRILEKPKGSATRVNILATGAAATAKE
jgi:hypothetical protein